MSSSVAKSFDAVSHGTGTPYLLVVEADASVPARASAGYQARADQYPLRRGVIPHAREIPFRLIKGSTAASDEEWFATVMELYAPERGVRLLVTEHDGVDVQLPVDVLSVEPAGVFSQIIGVFGATDAAWTGTATPTPDTASPTTPTGTTDALPVVTFNVTSNCQVVEIQITANNDGGFADFPIQIGGGGATEGGTWDTSASDAAAAADFIVFHDGRPVPFFIQDPGGTNQIMHVLVAGRKGETVTLTIFYGAGINNTVTAQTFAPGGLALDHASMGNDRWVWRNTSTTLGGIYHPSVWEVLSAPRRPGSWHPATVGTGATSFRLDEISGGVNLNASGSNLDNNADAIVLFCPVPADATFALQGFYPENQAGSVEYAAAVLYLRQGDAGFRQPGGTIISDGYDVDGAVMIAFAVGAGVNLVVDQHAGTAAPQLPLDSASLPTVVIGTPENAVVLNGTLTNSTTGDIIYVTDVYMKAQDLIVDTLGTLGPATRDIRTENDDPIFMGSPNAGVTFSNRRQWWPMRPGVANSWVWSGTAGVTFSIDVKPRYRLL